ncbi:phage major capsid protein, P2 family [Stenotrophomonas sp. MMGLT7]|uniref:phage major capsid protein, P2 family n=1 Tax=Stenotrophomonas sp. MMGLT7 TaxID=2901227 RepID=UPI001E335025|nr:phage major capsid protein, P2 family [Stenotrophomonas sp. MMGLT7]MCD7096996.1 phage major capsid protein, P2 family [Stenotrophomonas sp. MMGLT7]
MRNTTRVLYNAMLTQIAQLNGVADAAVQFSATPSVQQTLETRIQESSAFLSQINMIGVRELAGEKVGITIGSTIASRTDTSGAGVRSPINVADTDANGYLCKQTNFDTGIPYGLLDAWAKFTDFQTRVRDAIIRRQALDRIMIGFNGLQASATTDRATYPLLQDVNIGWLQQYRTHADARVLDSGAAANVVKIGGTAPDYANLDALVMDAVNSLIDPWYQDDTSLVAIVGRDLLNDKYFQMVNQDLPPTEQLAADIIKSKKQLGGLPALRVPFFPTGKILITSLSNLSLYWQEEGRRRYLKEEPEKNRIANYESSNDAYVVEDYGFGALIENIQIGDAVEEGGGGGG